MSIPWRDFLKVEELKQNFNTVSVDDQTIQRLKRICNWPSFAAKKWVENFIILACPAPSLKAIVLLGSIVRPVNNVNDVDVLYIYSDKPVKCPNRPIDVDMREYEQKNIESLLSQGNELLSWAILFGYLVCENNMYWTSLCKKWQNKLPFPEKEIARARAQKAEKKYNELYKMGDIQAANEMLISKLTHEARIKLISKGIYPKSRPELPDQLRSIEEYDLARSLHQLIPKFDDF